MDELYHTFKGNGRKNSFLSFFDNFKQDGWASSMTKFVVDSYLYLGISTTFNDHTSIIFAIEVKGHCGAFLDSDEAFVIGFFKDGWHIGFRQLGDVVTIGWNTCDSFQFIGFGIKQNKRYQIQTTTNETKIAFTIGIIQPKKVFTIKLSHE